MHAPPPRPLLVLTGAFGRMGRALQSTLREHHRVGLVHLRTPDADEPSAGDDELLICDLPDAGQAAGRARDAVAVVHLAGHPRPTAPWPDFARANLAGTSRRPASH